MSTFNKALEEGISFGDFISGTYHSSHNKDKAFVLIDTDAGTDDALAIWMVIRAHQDPSNPITLVGITCVNGNTTVNNVGVNVARILRAAGEYGKIPIFLGASDPILDPFKLEVEPFHGANGFGDVDHELEPIDSLENIIEEENCIQAMIRLALKYRGDLTILALGPLTNLALAVRVNPALKGSLRNIYCMGGNIEGEGNATISAEFNFAIDPEAAYITLTSFSCPIIIAPWETCKRETKSWDWRVNSLGAVDTPQAKLLNQIEAKILEIYKDGWIPCDQLAAAALVDPKVVKKFKSMHCTVELHGQHTRGLLILDHQGLRKMPDNVVIITGFDSTLCEKLMVWGLGGEDKP